jgi:eukaryotic-like serine/threonine-protein kinase
MAIATATDLLELIRRSGALESKQLQQAEQLAPQVPEPKAFAREVVQRGWLTAWQITQICKGQSVVLGGYVVQQVLGEGGMGQVFKARHQKLRRLAALKVIRKECLASASAVDRFVREAEAAARLSHPNIVTVYDAGEANGTHFLAMEFVEGTDLGKLVKESGPLPIPHACDYIRQAALGLQHAHEQGLVHRDIKPSNLMLNDKGVVKLMDLGLARLNPAAGGEAPTAVTASGAVVGTPDYIAPEQALNAKNVDIRADIYSLGCSLYHFLTGKPPFTGESMTEKLLKHQLDDAEPVEKLRSGLPKKLSAVVRRMIAKRPEKRYQTPNDVADALKAFAGSGGAPATVALQQRGTRGTAEEPVTIALNEPSEPAPGRKIGPLALLAGLVLLLLGTLAAVLVTARARPTSAVGAGPWPIPPPLDCTGKDGVSVADVKAAQQAWAKYLGRQVEEEDEIAPGVKMAFVLVPPGKFLMGSPDDEKGRDQNETQHEVEITRPFYLAKYPVTQAQYQAVTTKTPSNFKGDKLPVEQVSWDESDAFARALPKQRGVEYRLPREAEWEYACRGGRPASMPFGVGDGKSLSSKEANCNGNLPYGGAAVGPWLQKTSDVGSYAPNALGLYDMHGNLWQWCGDWAVNYPTGKVTDPTGPPQGWVRVLRSGCWEDGAGGCRAAIRIGRESGLRFKGLGFRLARVPSLGT